MLKYFVLFFSSFGLSILFTPIIRKLAFKYGFVAYPREDRWHKKPTAVLGGAAIYLSSLIPILFLGLFNRGVFGLLSGASFLFIVGLLDDKFHFTPYAKLFAQIIAACIAIFSGITLELPFLNLVAIPLTIIWIVGVTNAFNLLDNIDGLASGTAFISALLLFFSSQIFSNNPLGIYAIILSGAALGFLPYNFNPARIFMGDSGSMFLGYTLAVISIADTTGNISNLAITIVVPVLILSVPIFDTIFVVITRIIQGRRIFTGGKDHTSHHLVTLGLSQRKTVLLLYSVSLAFGLIAILYSRLNVFLISMIAILAAVILLFLGFFLLEASSNGNALKAQQDKNNSDNNKTFLNTVFLHKRRIVEVLLDFIFICLAYYSAYFLRFEGAISASNAYVIRESLVWIILIKMSLFFFFGLYHGVWRYISISDLVTIFKVTTFGSIVSILFLTFAFRFQYYSRAVFFIDWMLLLFLLSGSRILFRLLGEFFSRMREKGENILIFGAGDTGEMVIREIKRNKELNYNPVGFIDDNPAKIGNRIQGIPVLGSREDIVSLIGDFKIKEILIAIPSINKNDLLEITGICRDAAVPYRIVKGILDSEESIELKED